MTATKEIYRVNLFLNPLFSPSGMHMGAFNEDNSGFMPGDGTFSVVGRNAQLLLPELEVGSEYVFRCEVVAEQEDDSTRISLWTDSSVQLSNFVAPADGVILIRFRYRTGETGDQSKNRVLFGKGTYTHPQLELASTFDAAVSGGGFASSAAPRCRWRSGLPEGGDAR